MSEKSKVLQRVRVAEQNSAGPPPLQHYNLEEEEIDKYQIISSQYKALFRSRKQLIDNRPVSPFSSDSEHEQPNGPEIQIHPPQNRPSDRTAPLPNKVDTQYLKTKLQSISSKQVPQNRPPLLIQSTQEIIRDLPKDASLLEEAQYKIALQNPGQSIDNEAKLRGAVDALSNEIVKQKEDMWEIESTDYIRQISELEDKVLDLLKMQVISRQQQQSTQHGLQAQINKETNAVQEEIHKLNEKYKVLLEDIEIQQKIIEKLRTDYDELEAASIKQSEQLLQKISQLHEEIAQSVTTQISTLSVDVAKYKDQNAVLLKEIAHLTKLWKGDSSDPDIVQRNVDKTWAFLQDEIERVKVIKSKIQTERQKTQEKYQELQIRLQQLKTPKERKFSPDDPQNFEIFADYFLTNYSLNIAHYVKNKEPPSYITNSAPHVLRQLPKNPEFVQDVNPTIKMLRDAVQYCRQVHSSEMEDNQEYNEEQMESLTSQIQQKQLEMSRIKGEEYEIAPEPQASFSPLYSIQSRIRSIGDKASKSLITSGYLNTTAGPSIYTSAKSKYQYNIQKWRIPEYAQEQQFTAAKNQTMQCQTTIKKTQQYETQIHKENQAPFNQERTQEFGGQKIHQERYAYLSKDMNTPEQEKQLSEEEPLPAQQNSQVTIPANLQLDAVNNPLLQEDAALPQTFPSNTLQNGPNLSSKNCLPRSQIITVPYNTNHKLKNTFNFNHQVIIKIVKARIPSQTLFRLQRTHQILAVKPYLCPCLDTAEKKRLQIHQHQQYNQYSAQVYSIRYLR